MKSLKHKLLIFVAIAGLIFVFLATPLASAAKNDKGATDTSAATEDSQIFGSTSFGEDKGCPDGQTAAAFGEQSDAHTCCPNGSEANATGCIFAKYINPFIVLLSAMVGVVVVIGIIIGAIQYSSAGGDPSKTAAAKKRIANSIFALVAYFFLFTILEWLTPGGI